MNTANARTIVLTGSSGFVGRQILRELTSRGQKVRVLVRDKARLGPDYKSMLVEVFEIPDLFAAAPERLDEVLTEADLLIHAAWYAEPGQYLTSPINLHCLEGTLRLVEAFCRTGGKRVVGLGTCAEYDFAEELLTIESPLKPNTLYAACKTSAFQILSHFLSGEAVEFAWCRLFYLYGEGEDQRRLVPYIRKQLQAGEPALLTSGHQVRDFIDVHEAARLIVAVALGEVQGAANICTSTAMTVRELAERIADEYGRRDLLHFGSGPDNLFDPPRVVGVPGPFHA
jgi:nucleoside-diphosphate-sugar epimerase